MRNHQSRGSLCDRSISPLVKTHFQNLLLAQPSQRSLISHTMSGTADPGVWTGIGMGTVQVLEFLALTHVAQGGRKGPKLILVARSNTTDMWQRPDSKLASGLKLHLRRIEHEYLMIAPRQLNCTEDVRIIKH